MMSHQEYVDQSDEDQLADLIARAQARIAAIQASGYLLGLEDAEDACNRTADALEDDAAEWTGAIRCRDAIRELAAQSADKPSVSAGAADGPGAVDDAKLKAAVVAALQSNTREMEGYSYFGTNPGVREDEYEEVVDEAIAAYHAAISAQQGPEGKQ